MGRPDAAQLDDVFVSEPFLGDPRFRRRPPAAESLGHAVELQQPADGRRGAARQGGETFPRDPGGVGAGPGWPGKELNEPARRGAQAT
jgi:hypothetical protein